MIYKLLVLPLFLGWQLQGGVRQSLQTPQSTQINVVRLESNQEDSENLQDSMGYATLSWTLQDNTVHYSDIQALINNGALTVDQ